jgi:hypothetical protein
MLNLDSILVKDIPINISKYENKIIKITTMPIKFIFTNKAKQVMEVHVIKLVDVYMAIVLTLTIMVKIFVNINTLKTEIISASF